MSLSWFQRKTRLASLLKSRGDEDADGLALDRILHGQSVIGKTAKTTEIDTIRFQDKDLSKVGTLEFGQFGVIDVVTCRLDGRVYVCKSIEKRFALRTREQCSPQFERDLLLQAVRTDTQWAPHLLCAFQTPTHLNLVMDYAEGGTLWDVLESSPHDGRIPEADLMWWTPQVVSAIHWCHSQGFAHRDIKPHNFVLTPEAHILLIDFGSAAPLLPPGLDGTQLLPKRYCLVPCGTCDYISPEILKAHEEALVALEMEEDDNFQRSREDDNPDGYGRETDWWSLGAMLYEMAFGVAPFFAKDIRQTYLRIIDHEKSLRFNQVGSLSPAYENFLRRLLTHADQRLGHKNIIEVTSHPIFESVNWDTLTSQSAPPDLHLPQFTYAERADPSPAPSVGIQPHHEDSHSQGFAFSALFQSSQGSSPGLSILRSRSSPFPTRSLEEDTTAAFIGFSWGPTLDAFPSERINGFENHNAFTPSDMDTPRPLRVPSTHLTPNPAFATPRWTLPTPNVRSHMYSTPMRPNMMTPLQTLPRTSTIRRTVGRRSVSDREAMQQLVNCVGMSARKKVLESGRKPRVLNSFSRSSTLKKELRFLPAPLPIPDYNAASPSQPQAQPHHRPKPIIIHHASSGSEDTDSEGPPSPSPTPRPGSAMSMMSRRSGTPTTSSLRTGMSTLLLPGGRSMSFSRSEDLSLPLPEPVVIPPAYDEMEERHGSITHRIRDLEERLSQISALVR